MVQAGINDAARQGVAEDEQATGMANHGAIERGRQPAHQRQGGGVGGGAENVTAKLPQKEKKVTAKLPQKPEVETENDFFTDDDFAGGFDLFGKVSSKVWRVEKRLYEKQDGTTMLYYNYRRRKGRYVNGKRVNVYKKGGKRIWQSKR